MFQQQGDVLIVAAKIPGKAKKKNSYILAEGEVTGHAHRVEGDGDAELLELGEKLFLRVMNGNVRVVHEEHKAQVIPPGEYEIRRVQEYNHFAEEARAVAD